MNILITGVAGLLGSRLAQWLETHHPEHQIVGIDDLSGGYRENVPDSVKLISGGSADVSVQGRLDSIFSIYKPEIVYHFAAYAAEGLSPFIRSFNYTNNLVATSNVVTNCIKYNAKRLVFTSSIAVYGKGNPPFIEDDIPNPIDPYGVAKYACEMDIRIAAKQHSLDYCIIRPHNVYGVNQNIWDKYRNVLGIWMYQSLNNQPMTIYGDGEQTRAFSYIGDCLKPFWLAGTSYEARNQIINLGGIHRISINNVRQLLAEITGNNKVEYLKGRHEVKEAYPTFTKSVTLLDYNETTTLEQGLKNMWTWAQKQPKREQFIWDHYELEQGIYDYWKTGSSCSTS